MPAAARLRGLDQHPPLGRRVAGGSGTCGSASARNARPCTCISSKAEIAPPRAVAQRRQEVERRRRRVDGDPGGGGLVRLRVQPEAGGGDEPERALGADQQVAEVVAHVVLDDPAQPVRGPCRRRAPPRPRGRGRGRCRSAAPTTPPALVASSPPIRAEPSEASDSGNSRPAARAAACTSASMHAGLGDEHAVDEVEVADAVHPLERDDDRRRAGAGHLPPDEAGAAGIGHDADPRLGAERHGARRVVRRPRQQHRGRLAGEASPRLLEVARLRRAHRVRPERRGEPFEQRPAPPAAAPRHCVPPAWPRRSARRLA